MNITDRFCALCGKMISEGVFCGSCSKRASPPRKVRVKECSKCGAFFHANKRVEGDVNEFLKEKFGHNIELEVSNVVCRKCNPKQFRAKVQLRGFEFKDEDVADYEEYIKDIVFDKDRVDILFSNAGKAFDFVRGFRKNHECSFKKTSSLVTQRKDGKRIYRPTFLLRKD